MTIRGGIGPRLRPALDLPGRNDALRRVFPFRRHWPAIGVVAVFDLVFLLPAIGTLRQAVHEWGRFDSLFDLVGAMFLSAWLLGWSIAPLLFTGVLALLLFGREVVTVRPGRIRALIGLPLVGLAVTYDPARMRNLRFQRPPPKSGKSWRGPHLAFDYGVNQGELGAWLDAAAASTLKSQIESAAGAAIRNGPELPGDAAEEGETPVSSAAVPAGSPAGPAPVSLASPSALMLIAANLVPLVGAAFLGWRLSDVMVLYWAESAVIGLFNLGKIIVIGRWFALLAGPFFVGHFGGFMAVHFLFIYTLFVEGPQAATAGDLGDVARLFVSLWPALAALFASHAYSFFANFVGRREYIGRSVQDQMGEPYARIVFMHLVLIFGGFLTLLLGGPAPVLVGVIVLKIVFDARAHLRQHGGLGRRHRGDRDTAAAR